LSRFGQSSPTRIFYLNQKNHAKIFSPVISTIATNFSKIKDGRVRLLLKIGRFGME